jgi:ATP-binding cassette subfamily B protein RaxB
MVFQSETAECGLTCLAMVAGYHGMNVSVSELRARSPVSLKGLSMRGLSKIASQIGMNARVVRCEIDDLRIVSRPALLHWDLQHLVVLKRATADKFVIHDPSRGIRVLRRGELSNHFTGILIELNPGSDFKKAAKKKRLNILDLIGPLKRIRSTLLQVLYLSVLLEMLVLIQPLFIRNVVDVAIANKDLSLTYAVAGLLALAAVLHGFANFSRDYAVLRAGTTLNFQMTQRIFGHALKLPLSFFERRPIGHLIERYRATDYVEDFVISSLPLALIDGLVTALSLSAVFFFSVPLGLLSVATLVAYLAIRASRYQATRTREQDLVWSKGEENGYLIETLKSIFTAKVNALEETRFNTWSNYYAALIQAQRRFGTLNITQRSAKIALIGLNLAFFILLAANAVSYNAMTIGTLFAILFYNSHFILRSMTLVERLFEFRLLGVRLERLEDIVFTETEMGQPHQLPDVAEPLPESGPKVLVEARVAEERKVVLGGEITIENLSFRYSPVDDLVLKDLSCHFERGEFVALVGENGAGKTTLMKLLLGLYWPTVGTILFDGTDIRLMELPILRSQIGVVTQSDQLLTGTVAENIALFDPEIDMEHVAECAELACIRRDIEKMPMGYSTRVGNLGSPFSQGQTQKIFLARALYRRPRILMMDEGTANLDTASEDSVLTSLEKLPLTKLMIAHRAATIRRATRVLSLQREGLLDISAGRDLRQSHPGPASPN